MLLLAAIILYFSREVIAPFVLAFFLAYAINPLVLFLQKKGSSRTYAILTVYFGLVLITILIFMLIVPQLIEDLSKVMQRLPVTISSFEELGAKFVNYYKKWNLPPELNFFTTELIKRGELSLKYTVLHLAQWIVGFFSRSAVLILVPLLAFYYSRDYPKIKQSFYQWILLNLGCHWTATFLKIDAVFRLYIRCQLLDTMIVGGLIGLGLGILGLDAAFLLGMVAGIFNLIPYFGPVLGAIPSLIFALLKSPWLALYVVILFALVNQFEAMILAPKIFSGGLGLHPITVVFLILIGGKMAGLLGMIFAVPLGAIFLIVLKSIYEICFGKVKSEPIPEKSNLNNPEVD